MWNWSVDEKKFKKNHPKQYRLWCLVQLINYGLDKEEKLDRQEVIKAWPKIKDDLDSNKALFIKYLIWGVKPSSNQFTENSWKPSTKKTI